MTLWEGAGANNTSAKWMRVDKDATRLLGGIQVYRAHTIALHLCKSAGFQDTLVLDNQLSCIELCACVQACRRAYRRACLCAKEVVHNN